MALNRSARGMQLFVHSSEGDLNTDGSGARIRTVNLAVNSRLLYR
jgi:hypothetical protein